jgi:hypothetical protein
LNNRGHNLNDLRGRPLHLKAVGTPSEVAANFFGRLIPRVARTQPSAKPANAFSVIRIDKAAASGSLHRGPVTLSEQNIL